MKYVKKEIVNNFCIVTLNRPEVKNAFDPAMIEEITLLFKSLNKEESLQAIILKGEGSVFCSGADLNWMKSMVNYNLDENKTDSRKLWDMFAAVRNCQYPVIGKAHGAVFGGALGLLACCDYVMAEENTKFCFSEVKLGLSPAVISSFIIQKCADAFVRPLMLSGEVFSTADAQRIGLVFSSYKGDITVQEIIQKFSNNGAYAMIATKLLLNTLSEMPQQQGHIQLTTETISKLRISEDAQARLKVFLNK